MAFTLLDTRQKHPESELYTYVMNRGPRVTASCVVRWLTEKRKTSEQRRIITIRIIYLLPCWCCLGGVQSFEKQDEERVLTTPKAVSTTRKSGANRNWRNRRNRRYVDDTARVVVSSILS